MSCQVKKCLHFSGSALLLGCPLHFYSFGRCFLFRGWRPFFRSFGAFTLGGLRHFGVLANGIPSIQEVTDLQTSGGYFHAILSPGGDVRSDLVIFHLFGNGSKKRCSNSKAKLLEFIWTLNVTKKSTVRGLWTIAFECL